MSGILDDWQTLNPLLEEALTLPLEERARFVDGVADPSVRSQLRQLLAGADEKSTLLCRGGAFSGELGADLIDELTSPDPAQPATVGPYRLKHEVGRGGMAQVFLAARADGAFEQQVAIKIMWPGLLRGDLLQRFQQERQILAQVTHPHVARLLDGGITDDGRPWLAMEYIPGTRIDDYCDHSKLNTTQRIRLVRDVMGAVAAAHRLGVIHRDIKPGNILVEQDGTARLLDFGIAKQIDAHAAEETLTEARVLTPQYASPEQIQGRPVSRESDIYQLGLLLFELLTGERPFSSEDASPLEYQRRVVEDPPPRPNRIARQHQLELSPDLDAIILKALEKDPAQRYSSVEDFSRDLDHLLRGLPVTARAGRRLYRAGKFVVRHRWAVATAALVFLLLVGWGGSMTWQAYEIERERDAAQLEAAKAAEMAQFVMDLFEYASPGATQGQPLSIRQMVDRGADQLAGRLDDQAPLKADLLENLGRIYTTLGDFEAALAQLDQAALLRAAASPEPVAQAGFLEARAAALRGAGRFEEALELLDEVLALRSSAFGERHPSVAQTYSSLGDTFGEYGKSEQSSEYYRRALELNESLLPEDHLTLAMSRGDYGIVLHRQGRAEEAAPFYEKALRIQEPKLGASHPATLDTLRNLAVVEQSLDNYARARTLLLTVLERERSIYTDDHPRMSFTLGFLARVAEDEGKWAEAESYWRETHRVMANTYGPQHLVTAGAKHAMAQVLLRRDKHEEACQLFSAALLIREAALDDTERRVNGSRIYLALCRARQARFAEAAQLITAAEPHISREDDLAVIRQTREIISACEDSADAGCSRLTAP
ncbi:MAG: serine/threonine-protein kinase [Pseudomonadota bacterium]